MVNAIYIGSDHAGFELKQHLIELLSESHGFIDCGAQTLDPHDDYPNYGKAVCEKVLANDARGILICDTGVGMSIVANRYKGIRAALVTTEFMAERSRMHNNSNVLCLGQDVVSRAENESFVKLWLATNFDPDERHIRRLSMIDSIQ